MRTATKYCAVALIAGMGLFGATAAFAGADDGNSKSFFLPGPGAMTGDSSVSAPAYAAPARSSDAQYRATYAEPRQNDIAAKPATVPAEYYHAMGTMGVP